jgi:hypothetical protein
VLPGHIAGGMEFETISKPTVIKLEFEDWVYKKPIAPADGYPLRVHVFYD